METKRRSSSKLTIVLVAVVVLLLLALGAALLFGGSDDGKSAYELAVENGFTGTQSEWVESLAGADGKSAFELAVESGYTGSELLRSFFRLLSLRIEFFDTILAKVNRAFLRMLSKSMNGL